MAFSSLFTLLDDIASILDDVALMTKSAAKKTVGVLGDDLALNADQVAGARADRELPIVWAVAKGSLVNKAILIPLALVLSTFLPQAITPLLMLGGAYLCFEGVEKLLHKWLHQHEVEEAPEAFNEQTKIKGAIRTDFILSAEIIIIALGVLAQSDFITRIISLCVIGVAITILVYGLVAVIVKADDVGLYLMQKGGSRAQVGKVILAIMPKFMRGLTIIGTLAMFLVGGGIFVHNWPWLHHWLEAQGLLNGLLENLANLVVGLIVGAITCAMVLPILKLIHKKS